MEMWQMNEDESKTLRSEQSSEIVETDEHKIWE